MHTLVLAAEAEPSGELRAALKRAGGNRSELETALRGVKGKDTEYLIAHASQYDLVNLTAQQIIENISYARKVHETLPYLGEKLEYELWRDWVLPHRVLEEDLSLWRMDFHEQFLRAEPPVRLADDKSKETRGKFNTGASHRQHDTSRVPPNPADSIKLIDAGAVFYQWTRCCAGPSGIQNRDPSFRHRLAEGALRTPGGFGVPCQPCQGGWLPG